MTDKKTGTLLLTGIRKLRPKIDLAIENNGEKYQSVSHYIRIAIIKQLDKDGIVLQ